jgi:hypothetical protein
VSGDLKYPGLRALLEPTTTPAGQRGSTVRCPDSGKSLGFVWWDVAGNGVRWHYRTPGGCFGSKLTEQRAVEAVVRLQTDTDVREFDPEAQPSKPRRSPGFLTTARPAGRPPLPAPRVPTSPEPPKAAPAPIRWDSTTSSSADLTAAMAAAFRRRS